MAETETVVDTPTESLEAYFTRANVAEKDGTLALVDNPEAVTDPVDAVAAEPVVDEPKVEPLKAKGKPRNDPQARIDQAIAQKGEAERTAADAVARAAQLERDLAAARQPAKPTQPIPPPAAAAFPDFATWSATAGNETKPYEDYIDARADFRYEQRQQQDRHALQERQAVQSIQASSAEFSKRLTEQTADDPKFLETVNPRLLDAVRIGAYAKRADGTHYDRTTGETLPPPTFANFLMEQVFRSEVPKALLHHLSNVQEVQRLATLPPEEVIRAIAKVEALATGPAAADRGSAPVPKKSAAPDPMVPLGSSPVQSGDEPSDDEPLDTYIRRENAKDRKAGRL